MRIRRRNGIAKVALFFLLSHLPVQFASAATYGSGWYGEVQVSVGHEENVSRSWKPVDEMGDRIESITLGGGYSRSPGPRFRFVVSGYVSYNHHDEFDKLTNVASSLGASFVYQPGTDFKSLWYTASAEVTHLAHHDSEARDGVLLSGTLAVNRRMGLRSSGRLGYRYHEFAFLNKSRADARRDAAFEVTRHEVFAGADVHLRGNTWLVLEYGYQHGGFTTSISGWAPWTAYDARTEDSAFESCNQGACTPFSALRSSTDVHVADIGIAISRQRLDYDLSARYIKAQSNAGPDYSDWTGQFGIIWNF